MALKEKGDAVENAVTTTLPEVDVALFDRLGGDDAASEAEADGVDEASARWLAAMVDADTDEVEDEAVSGKVAWIRISWHCAPMYSSYRFPKAPLMHRHQLVEPPMASEPLAHMEKPPVYIAPACGGPSNWNWRLATTEPVRWY